MNALKYFAFFRYVPTVEEYFRFSRSRILPKGVKIRQGRVVASVNIDYWSETLTRRKISLGKINRNLRLLNFLGSLSWVRYLGISGSVSMLNAKAGDDLDLFVITKANRLWTARFFLLVLASLMGKRRARQAHQIKDKFCFNLFFCETDLRIPQIKQTEYVAHELLQLRPIVDKNQTYARLLAANAWIYRFFPQAFPTGTTPFSGDKNPTSGLLARWLEAGLSRLQWFIIKKHQTTERVSQTQLWFFPDDFEKRLAKRF